MAQWINVHQNNSFINLTWSCLLCNNYAKQKQLIAVKKALPSKVESMNLTGKKKDWYQVACAVK